MLRTLPDILPCPILQPASPTGGSREGQRSNTPKKQHPDSQVPTEHNLLLLLNLSLTTDGLAPYIWASAQFLCPAHGLEPHSEPYPIWWD